MAKSLRQSLELDPRTEEQKGTEELLATDGIMSLPWVTATVPGYRSHMGELTETQEPPEPSLCALEVSFQSLKTISQALTHQ